MNAHVQGLSDLPADASPVARRLEELRRDWTAGQRRLESLDAERQCLRETLLRIAGAIQVLEELSGETGGRAGADAT
jgi:prefoldin subunit 5